MRCQMKHIGSILKERREELGFSLEDISFKTKISTRNLEAIENGDIEYFKNDISYVRYFVRFYCQTLNIDFEPYKDELNAAIDGYNHTVALNKIKEEELIHENVKKRVQANTTTVRLEKKKIDYSLISLLTVIVLMSMLVLYAGTMVIPKLFEGKKGDVISESSIPTTSTTLSESHETTTEPLKQELIIQQETPILYQVKGYDVNQEVIIGVDYGSQTWARVLINDVVSDNPKAQTYEPGQHMEVIVNASNDLKVTIHLGLVKTNKIYINGQLVTLDASTAEITKGQQIHFVFKGE